MSALRQWAPQSVWNLLYIVLWISLSSTQILFNKYILSSLFPYPIGLTMFHSAPPARTQWLEPCRKYFCESNRMSNMQELGVAAQWHSALHLLGCLYKSACLLQSATTTRTVRLVVAAQWHSALHLRGCLYEPAWFLQSAT